MPALPRLMPPALFAGGILAIAAAFAVDLLGAGQGSGFGQNQLKALVGGLAMLGAGAFVSWANGRGGVPAVVANFWTAEGVHRQAHLPRVQT